MLEDKGLPDAWARNQAAITIAKKPRSPSGKSEWDETSAATCSARSSPKKSVAVRNATSDLEKEEP